jgi:hypothetical protein
MSIRVGIFRVVMCEHGPSKSPDDRDEAACAFYEHPENLVPTGPGRKRRPPEVGGPHGNGVNICRSYIYGNKEPTDEEVDAFIGMLRRTVERLRNTW